MDIRNNDFSDRTASSPDTCFGSVMLRYVIFGQDTNGERSLTFESANKNEFRLGIFRNGSMDDRLERCKLIE